MSKRKNIVTASTVNIIITIMSIAGFFSIIKIIEKNIPILLKRKRVEWETEKKREEDRKVYAANIDIEIQKVVNDEKKRIYTENKKKVYKDNIRKGRDYEIFILNHFKKQGYITKAHGLLNGKKDKGIDLIIMLNKEITLIQCKNWKENSSYKIKHKELKEFLGNTTAFLDNNKEKADGYTIKRLYITSNDVLDNSARHFLRENSIVEHVIIPMIL